MIIGIVGKPSCGKSTFFKAATLADVEIANYPFTTIKPNHAMGFIKIKDPAIDFNKRSNPRMGFIIDNYRFVPVDLIDVAGLVPNAHKGEGMGFQFLNDLNQADALIHVIDISGSVNEKGEPVPEGSYDPANDILFLENELDYWFLEIIKKGWDKIKKRVMQEKLDIVNILEKQMSGVRVNEDMIKETLKELGPPEIKDWNDDMLLKIARSLRKKSKPIIIAANKIDKNKAEDNFKRIKEEFKDYIIIPTSAEIELALREAHKKEIIKYIPGEQDFKIINDNIPEPQKKALEYIKNFLKKRSTGVQEVINKAVFDLLKYKAIFPGGVNKLEDSEGNVLPDCFLMPEKATALDFAYKLHTDFGKNFIKAIDVRTKMPVGKEHILNNFDIIEIMAKK